MIINLNGRIVSRSEARISLFDHGFLYGASVYETLRTYEGRPFLVELHLKRLKESAESIHVTLPLTLPQFKEEIEKSLREAQYPEAYLRLIVTPGEGDLGYDPALCRDPVFIILVMPLVPPPAEIYESGVAITIVEVRRNHPLALNPAIKSGNLLNPLLAWNEGHHRGAYESLMMNLKGELTECTMSNVFLAHDGVLKTPAIECGILPGLTRNLVLAISREIGVPCLETSLFPEDLFEADEAFLTVTSREIIPVISCDAVTIGSGTPGPITRRLHQSYRVKVKEIMAGDMPLLENL
jgi:branched-chain amino acid aminotransferase